MNTFHIFDKSLTNTYNEIKKSIFAAERIIRDGGNVDDRRTYGYATRGCALRSMQASRGASQSSTYAACVNAYGAHIVDTQSSASQNIPMAIRVQSDD